MKITTSVAPSETRPLRLSQNSPCSEGLCCRDAEFGSEAGVVGRLSDRMTG